MRFDRSTARKGAKYVDDRRGQSRGRTRRPTGFPMGGGRGTGGGRGMAAGGGGVVVLVLGLILAMCAPDLLSGGGSSDPGLGPDNPFGAQSNAFDDVNANDAIEAAGGSEIIDCDVETKACMQALMFDIQDTWDAIFDEAGLNYQPTSMVIFEDQVDTGCGRASSAVGPFYCPAPNDQRVYIDLGFYRQLATQFGAPGDFAQAYVVAHEVGHHLQSITGTSDRVRQLQRQDPGNKNEYSIRQELQADCLAGVWAHSANGRLTRDSGVSIFEPGDIEEGLRAAASVGDDRIQESAGMTVDPHTWTHGSAEQRMQAFRIGFDDGRPELCTL